MSSQYNNTIQESFDLDNINHEAQRIEEVLQKNTNLHKDYIYVANNKLYYRNSAASVIKYIINEETGKVEEDEDCIIVCKSCNEGKTLDNYTPYDKPNKFGIQPRHTICKKCYNANDTKVKLNNRKSAALVVQETEEQNLPLWDMLEGETHSEFAAWTTYRDLYPDMYPTMKKVSALLNIAETKVIEYARKWNWNKRMEHWVRYYDADVRADKMKRRRDMLNKHIAMAQKLHDKAMERLENLDPNELEPNELAKWLELSVKIERLSLGLNPAKAVDDERVGEELEQHFQAYAKNVQDGSPAATSTLNNVLEVLRRSGALKVTLAQEQKVTIENQDDSDGLE